MATNTHVSGIRVTDENSNKWDFPLMPTDRGGVGLVIEPQPWEPGDPLRRWRVPLHPWEGGLNIDRLTNNPTTYAQANADASNKGELLFPPYVATASIDDVPNWDGAEKAVFFDGKMFFIGGRYLYYYNPATRTYTEDKDFGSGKASVDGAVFNGELVIAMGETEKIYKRSLGTNTSGTADAAVTSTDTTLTDTRLSLTVDGYVGATVTCNSKTMVVTSNTATTFTGSAWSGGSNPGNGNSWSVAGTWTQASDATYAIALGTVGSYLWRGESVNKLSNCFPGTTVAGIWPGVKRIYRRWYDGEVATITTAGGRELTGTPNHPILTQRGWIGIGEIAQGDYVVSDSFLEQVEGKDVPNEQYVPTPLGQVFDTAVEMGGRTNRIASLGVDFHGDGREGYVDVVTTDGQLMNRLLSALLQPTNDILLPPSCQAKVGLPRKRPTLKFLFGAKAASCVNRLLRRSATNLNRGVTVSDGLRLAVGADFDALLAEHKGNGHVADAKPLGERHSVLGSGQISLDSVVDVAVSPFSGYVYNLETEVGAYVANNIVTHNCASTPLTLANWIPASPNQYAVGDTTYAVNGIVEYGGIPWVGKGDGVYAPDPQSRFKNQTPQLARAPHADNTVGMFIAHGALWVPSSSGLFQVRAGRSRKMGPEITYRPDYRFWVRGGVEYGEHIYLITTDESGHFSSSIIKMTRDDHDLTGNEYIYHELVTGYPTS